MKHSGLSRYIGSAALIVVVLCLLSASFAYAETIYVNSTATGTNDGTSWGNAYVDLQIAIDAAASGDEIWVAARTYRPTSWPNGGNEDRERHFSLKNGLSIYGGLTGTETSLSQRDVEINETILSGDIGIEGDDSDNCFHVFYHPEGTDLDTSAVLDGFTITEGNADGSMSHHHSGGGMHNHSSSPTLVNCTFSGNRTYYSEYHWGEEKIYHYGSGGGIYNFSSSPQLTNCTFKSNGAYIGGGIYDDSSSSPRLIKCTFIGNSAYYYGNGGGMHNSSSSPTLTNCTFNGNWAYTGGGMYNASSSPALTNCIFSGNSAYHAPDWGQGGGIYNSSSSPTLSNCTFSYNSAGFGGGMLNSSSYPALVNCTFSGNSANDYGGGMYNTSSSPSLTNCVLWNNNAYDSGNDLYNNESTPVFAYCDIKGAFDGGVWDAELGTDGGNNIDSNPLFMRNPGTNSADDPGDLHLAANSPCIDTGNNSAIDVLGTDLDGESRIVGSTVDMGADEYLDADDDDIPDYWETKYDVDNPNDDPDGDGLNNQEEAISGTDPTQEDSDRDGIADGLEDYDKDSLSTSDELIRGTKPNNSDTDGDGYNDREELYHESDPTSTNSIPGYPVIIYVDIEASGDNTGRDWNNAFVELDKARICAISGDEIWIAVGTYEPTSWPNGGSDDRERHFSLKNGVSIYGGFTGTETSLDERDFETNETFLNGGGSYHVFYHPEGTDLDTSAVLDGVIITGGHTDISLPHRYGGGIYNSSSSPKLINCTFSENVASDGGGMYNRDSSPELTNCTFNSNRARFGNGGGMYNRDSSPKLTNCTFNGNKAYYGGGIYNDSSSPELIDCSFNDNSTEYSGGGMSNNDSFPRVINCIFSGNLSRYQNGGGMQNFYSSPILTNCTFNGNLADYGGGIYNDFSSPTLTNCTFSGNSANDNGGGISNLNSSPILTNCILWINQVSEARNEISNYVSKPIIAYCDIQGSFDGGVWDEDLGTDGGHNIDADPLFVRNPGTNVEDDPGDLHLTADSPCIDAGDPSFTNGQDMDGEIRVFDGDGDGTAIVDMGADEYIDSDYDGIVDRHEPPGIIAAAVSGNTGEDGTSTTFDVKLNSPPNDDVILLIESTDDSEGTVSPSTLTYTPLNWSTDQTVTIIGVDDDMEDGDQPYYVQVTVDLNNTQDTTGYLNLDAVDISVTNSDDGNDGSSSDSGSDVGDGSTGGSGGGGGSVSSEGGSNGGCFINTLFGAGG